MDRYKQEFCDMYFGGGEENILRCVIENEQEHNYKYYLNANGKLHSRYLEEFGCYEPAIICKVNRNIICLYWLFDGEIKDCLHPFMIVINENYNCICSIRYYSLERIQQQQPICLTYFSSGTASYNTLSTGNSPIIDDPNIPHRYTSLIPAPYNKLDMSQFVTIAPNIICPLWPDEFGEGNELIKFKFED